MKVASTRAELDNALGPRVPDAEVALVPTLGALHEGHEALFVAAGESAQSVVASIFVNPLQFGPGEDLASYPRTLDADLERCAANGVDVVFAPGLEVVYPDGQPHVTIDPGPLALELEGASRPGHFRGVLTVVVKLFGLVRPEIAIFGTKDYQQLTLIRRCVSDLCLPVNILDVETVRAPDGLALSSRNRYLSDPERAVAVALSSALVAGQRAGHDGGAAVLSAARAVLATAPEVTVDYLELRSPGLGPVSDRGDARLLVAARIGSTRLIDNLAVTLGSNAEMSTSKGS